MKSVKTLLHETFIGLAYSFRNFNNSEDRNQYAAYYKKKYPEATDAIKHIENHVVKANEHDVANKKLNNNLTHGHFIAMHRHEEAADAYARKLDNHSGASPVYASKIANKVDDHVNAMKTHKSNYAALAMHKAAIKASFGMKQEYGKNFVTPVKNKFEKLSDKAFLKYPDTQ